MKQHFFGHYRKKKRKQRPRFLSFSFSPSMKKCMYSKRTHSQTKNKEFASPFLCGEPVVWDFPKCYFLLLCSTSPNLSSLFIFLIFYFWRVNVPLIPLTPVFSYWLHWPSSPLLPNTCTFFFGALITLSFACNQMQKFIFFPSSFFIIFLVEPVPPWIALYLLTSVSRFQTKNKKYAQARSTQVTRQHGVCWLRKSSWLDLSSAPTTGRESPTVQSGDKFNHPATGGQGAGGSGHYPIRQVRP